MKRKKGIQQKVFMGFVAVLMAAVAGCSDGVNPCNTQGQSFEIGVFPTPVIDSFTADKEKVDYGKEVMLSYAVQNADEVRITSDSKSNPLNYSSKNLSSSILVEKVTEKTTFTLIALKNPPIPEEPVETTTEEAKTKPAAKAATVAGAKTPPVKAPPAEDKKEDEKKKDENAGISFAEAKKIKTECPAGSSTTLDENTKKELEAAQKENPDAVAISPDITGAEPKMVTAQVVVEINPASIADPKVESFYSSPSKGEKYYVDADGKAVLQWKVVPAEATVSITSSIGDNPVSVSCNAADTNAEELANGTVPGQYPAEGCATVEPSANTTYTLIGHLGEKQTEPSTVTILLSEAPEIQKFTINSGTSAVVTSYPSQVTLAWEVTPGSAKVTIAPRLKTAGQPLPYDSDETVGTRTVTVEGDTTFTLTASSEGHEDDVETVSVSRVAAPVGANCSDYSVIAAAGEPVFAGETVTLRWNVPSSGGSGSVTVASNSGEAVASGNIGDGMIDIKAEQNIYKVNFGNLGCPVAVPVAILRPDVEGKAVSVATAGDDVYVGFDEGYNDGKIKAVHYGEGNSETLSLDFASQFAKVRPGFLQNHIKTFPVTDVVQNPVSGRVFVATTGIVLHKAAAEEAWSKLPPLYWRQTSGTYSGEHPSCFGNKQTGEKGAKDGRIATLSQVCDLAASESGALYIATDLGILYADDIEAFITDTSIKPKGTEADNPMKAGVVNAVAINGSEVLAGGEMGLFKSEVGSTSWSSMDLSETVYGIAVGSTMDSFGYRKVYVVGTTSGVYTKDTFGSAGWEKAEGIAEAVYKVSVDSENSRTVYAAAASGLFVSRDGAKTFVKVPVGGGDVVVRSVGAVHKSDGFEAYVATESGVYKAFVPRSSYGYLNHDPRVVPNPEAAATAPTAPTAEPEPSEEPTVTEAESNGFSAGAEVLQ